MDKEKIRREWSKKVNECKASGQTQTQWCKDKNIDPRKFSYWFLRYKDEDSKATTPSNWIPLKVNKSDEKGEKKQAHPLNIKIGNVTIEIKPNFNPNLLLEVVKSLGALC